MKIIPHLSAALAAGALVLPVSAALKTDAMPSADGAHAQLVGFRIDSGANSAPQSGTRSNGSTRSLTPGLQSPNLTSDAGDQAAFLKIKVPKQSLYVGEVVPIQVKAYFRDGAVASLDGLPLLGGSAFAIGKLTDKPAQSEEMIGDEPYVVLTWDSTLSAVKAGDYPLSLDLPVVVRVREKGHRGGRNPFKDFFGSNSPFGSMFDDSFFDDAFANVTEKPLTLHTKEAAMHIQALPAAGRPGDFSGAVGAFDVNAEAPSASATAGDPLTLKIKISGEGNFDRVSTAGLAKSAAWKTYRPSAKFEPSDTAGLSGTKTFEQAVVPMQSGAQQIPPLDFSYFDPATGQYVTKHTDPIALNVAAADPTKAPAPLPAEASEPVADQSVAATIGASPIASLRPLIFRPWFLVLNASAVVVLLASLLVRLIHRSRSRDPRRLAREAEERALRDSLGQMDSAVQASDSAKFFEAARHVVQGRLAEHWHLPAIEITPALITLRLNGNGENLRALFRTADEAAYCGRRFTPAELHRWREAVKEQLHQIPVL